MKDVGLTVKDTLKCAALALLTPACARQATATEQTTIDRWVPAHATDLKTSRQGMQLLEAPARRELVVGHWHDNLDWVAQVPPAWDVVVYHDGSAALPQWNNRTITERTFDAGSESHVIAHHLATSYDSLADYTAFAPDSALLHSPNFLTLIAHEEGLAEVQTLSLRRNEQLPTAGVLQQFTAPGGIRSERISLRTGASLYYHDHESIKGQQYRTHYQLHEGVNLVADYLTSVGLPGWVPESQDVGTYAHGSMFGVSRDKVQQHPQSVYKMMEIKDAQSSVNAPVAEKGWLMLFGGPRFNDHPAPQAIR